MKLATDLSDPTAESYTRALIVTAEEGNTESSRFILEKVGPNEGNLIDIINDSILRVEKLT